MRIDRYRIESSMHVDASPDLVWQDVTQVDLASFTHPGYLSILGVPKPVRAVIDRAGVGGSRTAYFSNKRRFSQVITEWQPPTRYAFTFNADPGFRVGYLLDLSAGPFRMVAGAYRINQSDAGTELLLSSEYELRGVVGVLLRRPVKIVLQAFQNYLLRGIRANAERRARARG